MMDRISSHLLLIGIVSVLLIGPLVTLSLILGGLMVALITTTIITLCFCALYIFLVRTNS